ncbi:O-fucosyltransferase 20-like isoform X2 [Prosopis cineraria]|uniref:O-fucosyltransferase 20-like isoform X2 n=1 Tax=Prosopis cineraria TaxID=364024 RepID=UPI00240EE0DE|nr:O-fucosyltransferase 20-like isoform X2 [Prosopis cineraria]
MAKWKKKNNPKKLSYISVPSQIINPISSSSLQSLLDSPKKSSRNTNVVFINGFPAKHPKLLCFFTLFLLSFLGILNFLPFSPYPCATTLPNVPISSGYHLKSKLGVISSNGYVSKSELEAFSSEKGREENETGDSEFWKQPDGLGYRPCLDFSRGFRRESERIVKERKKYLMVVVAGGLNQQRNQIVDAAVIARILGAALVVPILQVNVIWGDESEFGEIFDLEHFKRVLGGEVRVVSALPSTHLMTRPVEGSPPPHVTPAWIRSRYLKRLNREGVLLLRGLDSRLSKDLPPDLQKLRCKVAFHALRFAKPVEEVGNKIAERMRRKGPYIALHLRMEKDVWVRTGCLPGLSPRYDEIVYNERIQRPELLTARSNMTYHQRKLAGLCPLNAMEVSRLLKALGASTSARIYWAGGQPLGGKEALVPIIEEFPYFYNKENLALPGELEPFRNKASLMAAIDYIVSDKSDVFMPSHGGNMGHAIQGHRAYAGHKKYITPNKRQMLSYFMNSSLPEAEFNRIIKELHKDSLGQPELRTSKAQRDVTKYPVPECMCNDSNAPSFI